MSDLMELWRKGLARDIAFLSRMIDETDAAGLLVAAFPKNMTDRISKSDAEDIISKFPETYRPVVNDYLKRMNERTTKLREEIKKEYERRL